MSMGHLSIECLPQSFQRLKFLLVEVFHLTHRAYFSQFILITAVVSEGAVSTTDFFNVVFCNLLFC